MKEHNEARRLFLQQSFGVLSTISLDVPGYPFGSVTPYCADRQCRPVIYISRIAQHTRNILADPRVSLTVLEKGDSDDVQARGRLTCIGNARLLGPDEDDAPERYFRYFPGSRQYAGTHDFEFFRLELVRLRFIGGFGQIYWIERDEFLSENPFSPSQEARILQHMNEDHVAALRHYAHADSSVVMVGIDSEGFDVLNSNKKKRFFFPTPISNMDEARQAFIAMSERPA
ncbi:MAG: heme iron utilization protein [Acidobacteria bacterium]|nr:MAG: heme iron utilization protein [Acidobacteriota bacterium]